MTASNAACCPNSSCPSLLPALLGIAVGAALPVLQVGGGTGWILAGELVALGLGLTMWMRWQSRRSATRATDVQALAVAADSVAGSVAGSVTGQATGPSSPAALRVGALSLLGTSSELMDRAELTTEHAGKVAENAKLASTGIQSVAAAAEEMAASVKEIAASSARASVVSADAAARSAEVDAAVQRLATSSSAIGSVVQTIASIAGQTNLLALNATIEAARAGEAGRGFAVVASEVKALAQQTAQATQDVGKRIAAIQQDTSAAAAAVAAISTLIKELDGLQQSAAGAAEEQAATTSEMTRSISDSATGVQHIASEIATIAVDARIFSMSALKVNEAGREMTAQLAAHRTDDHGLIPTAVADKAIRAHLAWRLRLLAATITGQPIDRTKACDHTACVLGAWMKSVDANIAGHPTFKQLDGHHRAFHAEVGRIIDLLGAGKIDEVRRQFVEGEFVRLSAAVVGDLAELRRDDDDLHGRINFAWRDAYATGHAAIDGQHRELFHRAGDLYLAMQSGDGQAKAKELLDHLTAYVQTHFHDEEAIMAKAGYTDLPAHQRLHQDLVRQVMELYASIKRGEPLKTLDVSAFLSRWLSEHILKHDHAYIGALRGAGLITAQK